ncbi:MAG: ATP synthase F0 subunit B [Acidimicrobiales bacterium]
MLSSILLAFEEPAHEGEVHAEPLNGVHFGADTNEIIWATIAFVVIVAVLAKVAGPAIKKGLAGRTARIEAELAGAKAARQQAEQSLVASTADLPDIDAEAESIRAEAEATAARLRVDIVEKAKADAEALRVRSAADIQNSQRQALADLREEVARLTRDATAAVITDNLDAAAHGDLIESYITQVNQL